MSERSRSSEMPLMTFEALGFVMAEHRLAAGQYTHANFARSLHNDDGAVSITGIPLQSLRDRVPDVDDETMAEIEERYINSKAELIDRLGLEDPAILDQLLLAYEQEQTKRDMDPEPWWPGLVVGHGQSHGPFASGVLAMARITNEPYRIHGDGESSGTYTISPMDEFEDIFPVSVRTLNAA